MSNLARNRTVMSFTLSATKLREVLLVNVEKSTFYFFIYSFKIMKKNTLTSIVIFRHSTNYKR